MAFAVILGLTLLSILQLSIQQGVDRTLVPEASGADVVRATVNKIQDVFGTDDHQFLRRIAFVESKDGTDSSTYRSGYHGGIWQVDEVEFLGTQDNASNLTQGYKMISEAFGIDWPTTVRWNDLRIPLYSAIAARLILLNISEAIPCDIRGQAMYWQTRYNRYDAAANNFSTGIADLNEGKPQQRYDRLC